MKNVLNLFAITLIGVFAMCMSSCNNGSGDDNEPVVITLSPSSLSFGALAGEDVVNVTATDWTATVDKSWVTLSPLSGNDGTITVSVTMNNTSSSRSATITVANSTGKKYVRIEQEAPSDININPSSLNFIAAGETISVTVESETEWTVVSNNTSWLTVVKTGNTSFTATATKNGEVERSTTITITNATGSKNMNATQAAAPPDLGEIFTTDQVEIKAGYMVDEWRWIFKNSVYEITLFVIADVPPASDPYVEFPNGTYTSNMTFDYMTVQTLDSVIKILNPDGTTAVSGAPDDNGTVKFEGNSDNAAITINLSVNGNPVKGYYSGPFKFNNPNYGG